MAVVQLALNGEGLGHLIRATIVAEALRCAGERPVLFSQGIYQPDGALPFPGMYVPSLWRAPQNVRDRVAGDLYAMAAISLPSIVVEDTHPNPVKLPSSIRRVLLVRPTSFPYLCRLRDHYGSLYATFLLCDSPGSPTWPYSEIETASLLTWDRWHVIGPIYRRYNESSFEDVRRRYRLSEDTSFCVFTMGGGGLHDPNDQDVSRFLTLSEEVADLIQSAEPQVRLIFVKGPYFPADVTIPARFEVVDQEQDMPTLLKLARGAVIRAGFNTTWECIAGGVPFMPLIGTTFQEPTSERLDTLRALGLLPADGTQFWLNREWREAFKGRCSALVAQFPGTPDPGELQRLILNRGPVAVTARSAAKPVAKRGLRITRRRFPLLIRVDDIACAEPTLHWLLDQLAVRGLRASFEVVPYLSEFDEELFDSYDPENRFFEVSQHGFAHVPRKAASGRRCEFFPESETATAQELDWIAEGRRTLLKTFPTRFKGGFSPPFDAMPAWLPAAWHAAGGTFVSCLYTNWVAGAPLPILRAGVDVWSWRADRALSRDLIRQKLSNQITSDRHAGIVLHPRCFRSSREKARLAALFDALLDAGAVSMSIGEMAARKRVDKPMMPAPIERFRTRVVRAFGGV